MDDLREFKVFAKSLADMSGKIIKGHFRTRMSVEWKSDESPVTIADKSAEELMRNAIMRAYPNHGIIGEEFGIHNEKAQYKWVLIQLMEQKFYMRSCYIRYTNSTDKK